jgi:hypothetical protein
MWKTAQFMVATEHSGRSADLSFKLAAQAWIDFIDVRRKHDPTTLSQPQPTRRDKSKA